MRPTSDHGISGREATLVWARVAAQSFGGPAGQIAVLHRMVVVERRWVSERRFLHALNFSMLLPGPEAQQLTTYLGWLLHGIPGGLIAGSLFILPGFLSILALSFAYVTLGDTPAVTALFAGITPVVVAIIAFSLVRLGRRVTRSPAALVLAGGAFVALTFFDVPFPLVVIVAAVLGVVVERRSPGTLLRTDEEEAEDAMRARVRDDLATPPVSWRRSLVVLAVGLALWGAPVAVLGSVFGADSVWIDQAGLFSASAMLTFGGAYAVLAFVAQQAVQSFAWVTPKEMIDGLALAESTPGPLIMVVQFVGFLAAARADTGLPPLVAGTIGALLTTWVTFVPSFLWVLLGAPVMEVLRDQQRLRAALAGISASVVGVIASLALWFVLHTLFDRVSTLRSGPLVVDLPVVATFDPLAAIIAVIAAVALVRWRWSVPRTLVLGASVGAVLALVALVVGA